MEKGFINMPSHTPLITARFTVVIMCVFLLQCVWVWEREREGEREREITSELLHVCHTRDWSLNERRCVRLPSLLSLCIEQLSVRVFCYEHNRVEIKRPCKTLMRSRHPDVTRQLKSIGKKKKKAQWFPPTFSMGPKFRRIQNLW